ncbi:hypothetical protein AMAG_05806 [Allomyces macrogynus ATCC 38327]|uniref:LIM zinc-binding domain-containing protein n=1 Tax=Allomyces macrogynus (strain ATCC 38327) TaxID=578462 RepID=A0A0L0SDD3_ALLM3|nr:hypothetical protein AMAG_05806 [Allomyces macrogynus ATCC 38327]|eukprot:KNE60415.1 hypothetical protein AMAG_05806 [Allomyces macrogynus ATCC 38327]
MDELDQLLNELGAISAEVPASAASAPTPALASAPTPAPAPVLAPALPPAPVFSKQPSSTAPLPAGAPGTDAPITSPVADKRPPARASAHTHANDTDILPATSRTCASCTSRSRRLCVLGTGTFFEHEGALLCQQHHLELAAPRCAYCSNAIEERCVSALGKTWHPEHFFCCHCGKVFAATDGFLEYQGQAYCEEDYLALFAPKCAGCVRPVLADTVNALDKVWHPACFACAECKAPFANGTFFPYESMPYCEVHYHAKKGSLCPACSKPIVGKCINAMDKRWHPACFVCSFCKVTLNKTPFKGHENKPFCMPCHTRLYG